MAIQFTRDEELPVSRRVRSEQEDQVLLLAGTWLGARAAVSVTVPAAVLLPIALRALRRAMVAADKLLGAGGEHWTELWMPAVLLAFLGALSGAAMAWRVMSAASTGRFAIWLVCAAALLVVSACGIVTTLLVFSPGVPTMCWISLGLYGASALAGVYLVIHWLD